MKLSIKQWLGIVILGLIGQLAWLIENMYLNLFVYHTISTNPNIIASMVAASAITATLTTIIVGSYSDRVGKRKSIIVFGYGLWGLSVLGFAWLRLDLVTSIFGITSAVWVTSLLVILWDCVMTFFGSSANDAAFNAWITDITITKNRGKVEAVLAVLPLFAMIIIFGGFDFLTKSNRWTLFFIIFGIIVMFGALLAHFFIDDDELKKEQSGLNDIVAIMSYTSLRQHPQRWWTLIFLLIIAVATQIWMPYLLIYIQMYLKITDYTFLLAVVLIGSSLLSILGGWLADRFGKLSIVMMALLLNVAGLIGMYLTLTATGVMVSGILTMGGNLILSSIAHGLYRDMTPKGMVGRFQGLRMIFGVMLPMIIGPFIGSAVIRNTNLVYEDLGVLKQVPTPRIFIASLIVTVLLIIPYYQLKRLEK